MTNESLFLDLCFEPDPLAQILARRDEHRRLLSVRQMEHELDKVGVKGRDEPVTIFEPIGLQDEVSKSRMDELKLWAQFLRLYRACDWDSAELQLLNLQRAEPSNRLYQAFADRIAEFRRQPPAAPWDGAYRFEAK